MTGVRRCGKSILLGQIEEEIKENGITDNHIIKDIVTERSKINKEKFIKVAAYIMANAGKEFSSKNIESFFVVNNNESLEKKMIYRYLDKMEKACLINRVKRFNIVGKQSMAKLILL